MSFITIAGGMKGYLAAPASPNGAGIVVIQEIFGVNAVMRKIADDLAGQGYAALVPDLFWRLEPGVDLTDKTEAEWKKALDLMNRFDVTKGVEDIQAAITLLRGRAKKVGAVGYCLGGLLAYLAAARTDADASVSYYGVNIPAFLGEAASIRKPLMLHIAAEDGFVPKAAQEQMIAGLNDNPNVTLHRYDGVDHAFARPGGQHYNQAAADLANSRTADFLRRNLA
ncbi:MAG: dienelactone hydrolase family protein [Alphaproteobacteria bacterium]|nr:dienelactone hydrolase family protein [Alphaproteobacteria bacterium]